MQQRVYSEELNILEDRKQYKTHIKEFTAWTIEKNLDRRKAYFHSSKLQKFTTVCLLKLLVVTNSITGVDSEFFRGGVEESMKSNHSLSFNFRV